MISLSLVLKILLVVAVLSAIISQNLTLFIVVVIAAAVLGCMYLFHKKNAKQNAEQRFHQSKKIDLKAQETVKKKKSRSNKQSAKQKSVSFLEQQSELKNETSIDSNAKNNNENEYNALHRQSDLTVFGNDKDDDVDTNNINEINQYEPLTNQANNILKARNFMLDLPQPVNVRYDAMKGIYKRLGPAGLGLKPVRHMKNERLRE